MTEEEKDLKRKKDIAILLKLDAVFLDPDRRIVYCAAVEKEYFGDEEMLKLCEAVIKKAKQEKVVLYGKLQ